MDHVGPRAETKASTLVFIGVLQIYRVSPKCNWTQTSLFSQSPSCFTVPKSQHTAECCADSRGKVRARRSHNRSPSAAARKSFVLLLTDLINNMFLIRNWLINILRPFDWVLGPGPKCSHPFRTQHSSLGHECVRDFNGRYIVGDLDSVLSLQTGLIGRFESATRWTNGSSRPTAIFRNCNVKNWEKKMALVTENYFRNSLRRLSCLMSVTVGRNRV